jgi:hypothetical protein
MVLAAVRELPTRAISTGHATIVLEGPMTILIYFRGAPPDLGALGIRRWIEHAAAIVRGYYCVFPVRILRVLVVSA